MFSSVRIENFRGFDDLTLSDLGRITLVSGRNNTGKSAVLEALFLLCGGPVAGQLAGGALRQFRGESPFGMDLGGDATPWDELFRNFSDDGTIRITGIEGGRGTVLTMERDTSSGHNQIGPISPTAGAVFSRGMTVSLYIDGQPDAKYRQTVTYNLQPQQLPAGGFPNAQIGNVSVNAELSPAAGPLKQAFFMGSRLRGSPVELATRYSNLRKRGNDRELLAALRVVEPRLGQLEVLVEQGQPVLNFELNGRTHPLSVLGEGVSSVVDFITSIYSARDGVVLIDELENGIHHSALEGVWVQVFRAAERARVQVVASTHSHECVVAARAALAKRSNELRLVRLRRPKGAPDSVVPVEYDSESLEGALEGRLDIR